MALMQGMRHDDGVLTGDSTYVQDLIPNPAFTPFLKEAESCHLRWQSGRVESGEAGGPRLGSRREWSRVSPARVIEGLARVIEGLARVIEGLARVIEGLASHLASPGQFALTVE